MKRRQTPTKQRTRLSLALLSALLGSTHALSQASNTEQTVYVLSQGSFLSLALENSSNMLTTPVAVTGLANDDELVAIDVRPQTGRLYGLANNPKTGSVQLYLLDYRGATATATAVGAAGSYVDEAGAALPILARGFDIDFNPTVDRLRVATTNGLNFRMNPNSGSLMDGDFGGAAGSIAGLNPDGRLNGSATGAFATAYTNNQLNATATTQYAMDDTTNQLLIQQPPNAGTLTTPLSVTVGANALDFGAAGGLDIAPGVNVTTSGTAAVGEGIAALATAGTTRLYRINLSTGAATLRGDFGTANVIDIAVAQTRAAAIALTGSGTQLVRFPLEMPGSSSIANITGVTAGERIVGIDLRPANGVLYALGIDADNDRGTLYRLEPQSSAPTAATPTAMATAIGATGQIRFVDSDGLTVDLSTISHGVDFNPVVDRLRVVDASGLNFRIDPNTGAPVDGNTSAAGTNPDGNTDMPLGSQLGATAYTNSIAGALMTTQYTLDQANGILGIQNPPNAGTQTLRQAILLGTTPFQFGGGVGFDIAPGVNTSTSNAPVLDGVGFFTSSPSAGMPQLYRLDLAAATATALGSIPSGGQDLEGLSITQASFEGTLAADSLRVMEQAMPVPITIRRTAGGPALIRFATANGTAIAGSDYTSTSGVLSFGSADTQATFNLPVLVDALDETPESILLNLTLPNGQTQTLTILIINDRLFANGFE
jgi:hypothetical protein